MMLEPGYPVKFEVAYPDQLGRLSTAFRIILFIPVAIFVALVGGQTIQFGDPADPGFFAAGGGGGIILAIWAAVIVREYVPHWMFDFQVALMRFQARAYGYLALLTDRFPAFEGEYPVNIDVRYPDKLNRWKVAIWKIITSIPHIIILIFLYLAAVVVVIIAWFAILFTGRYPQGLHTFVAGVFRWSLRVQAYVISLTDEYPPFSSASTSPKGGRSCTKKLPLPRRRATPCATTLSTQRSSPAGSSSSSGCWPYHTSSYFTSSVSPAA